MKMYGTENGEACYPLSHYKDELEDESIKLYEMTVYIGERWCKAEGTMITECGGMCQDYYPCNGKSGKCRWSGRCYTRTGRVFELSQKGLKEISVDDDFGGKR